MRRGTGRPRRDAHIADRASIASSSYPSSPSSSSLSLLRPRRIIIISTTPHNTLNPIDSSAEITDQEISNKTRRDGTSSDRTPPLCHISVFPLVTRTSRPLDDILMSRNDGIIPMGYWATIYTHESISVITAVYKSIYIVDCIRYWYSHRTMSTEKNKIEVCPRNSTLLLGG